MSTVVQVANFVAPGPGGLRTVLDSLASGYAARGHHVVQVLPGTKDGVRRTSFGRRVVLAAPSVPGTGMRVHSDLKRVRSVLAALEPDVVEVHDRTTLRGLGEWSRSQGVRSLVVSHERLDRWLLQWAPRLLQPWLPLQRAADRTRLALQAFDGLVVGTRWAAEEFAGWDGPPVSVVPLGVDLDVFRPGALRGARPRVELVAATRLSREKRPELLLATVRELTSRGVPVRLRVAGDGALRPALEREASGLPVEWLGHVRERQDLAALLRDADAVIAPGPVETFGLSALEALACGTPVLCSHHGALPEVVADAGLSAASSGFVMADRLLELLTTDEPFRRVRARHRAERFPWSRTVDGYLALHSSPTPLRLLTA